MEQNLGFGKLTSISAYRESQNVIGVDADATPTPLLDLIEAQRDKQISEEINLTSDQSSFIKWVAGLYYFGASSSYDPSQAAFIGFLQPSTPFGPIATLNNFGREPTESYAGYPQATAPAYDPEKMDAYEIGIKSDLFNRRLRLDAAAFYYDYTNLQVAKFTGSQTTYYNGAAARIYGLDTDFEIRPVTNLTVSGGFTLLNDRFTNFPDAVFALQVPGGLDTEIRSAAGNRLPQTADFTATANADYHLPPSFGGTGLELSYAYTTGHYRR